MPLIGLVCPNLRESRDKILQTTEKTACTIGVVHIGWCNIEGERQTLGIDQQMALATFYTFVRIVTTDTPGLLHGFHTLCVHDGRARMWILADPASFGLVQRPIDQSPKTLAAKLTPMIIDGLPGREVAWQVAPRTACAQYIKKRIEDRAEGMPTESSMR
jgi:hypothetical protein